MLLFDTAALRLASRGAVTGGKSGCGGGDLISSSLANMMTALALEVSSRRLMILSNSPARGSRGIFKDWAMHTPPEGREKEAFCVFFDKNKIKESTFPEIRPPR